jgi:hypothetical protein
MFPSDTHQKPDPRSGFFIGDTECRFRINTNKLLTYRLKMATSWYWRHTA